MAINISGGGTQAGGIATVNKGTIRNCYISGSIAGAADVGGIVGRNSGGTLENCHIVGGVKGTNRVGGIAGQNTGKVLYCYSLADVEGTSNVGGIAGSNTGPSTNGVKYCAVFGSSLKATGSGTTAVGRIIGTGNGEISQNYALAEMETGTNHTVSPNYNGKDGANMTTLQTQSTPLWNNSSTGFWRDVWGASTASDEKPWVWGGEAYPLPLLYWQTGNRDYPEHLRGYSAATPILVSTAAQLENMALGLDKHYRLTSDINMSGLWTPIGNNATPFRGSLDGNGHTIRNLRVSGASTGQIGMFGVLSSGSVVKRLALEGVYIDSELSGSTITSEVGGIAGLVNHSTIESCYVEGNIVGGNLSGGIAGNLYGGTIKNSYFVGNIFSAAYSGGIAALCSTGATIRYCYTVAEIRSSNAAGGIVYSNEATAAVEYCAALGDKLTVSSPTGTIGRVAAKMTGVLSDNYANEDMLLNGTAVTTGTGTAINENGVDVPLTATQVSSWWSSTTSTPNGVFRDVWGGHSDVAPWTWNTNSPILYWQAAN